MKLKEEVKGEQGLAALALGNFADEYEIEGDRQLKVDVLEVGVECARSPLEVDCSVQVEVRVGVGRGYFA
jgi:hypothetical protein